ncbi:MAG: hypothetical protein ACREU3_12000 [Steroidobacteraceae bacterium]
MRVIHFTHGATDPLWNPASGARFVPLADGFGATYLSCLHLEPGARIPEAPTGAATALLLVHGYGVLWTHHPDEMRIAISPGMGFVFESGARYSLESRTGMIYLVVESATLQPTAAGMSTPERIRGQLWPGETVADLKEPRSLLGRCIGDLEWPVRRIGRRVGGRLRRLTPRRSKPARLFEWETLPPTWRISAAGAAPGRERGSRAHAAEGPRDETARAPSPRQIEP